jgi:hypothetical protein
VSEANPGQRVPPGRAVPNFALRAHPGYTARFWLDKSKCKTPHSRSVGSRAQGLSGTFVFRHASHHCDTGGHPAVMLLFVTLQIDDQEGHLCEKRSSMESMVWKEASKLDSSAT